MSVPAQPLAAPDPGAPPHPPLPHTSVLLMILLAVVTLCVSIPIWYVRRVKALNALRSPVKLSAPLAVVTLALSVLTTGPEAG